MRSGLVGKEGVALSTSSIFSLLRNTEITCKRLYREPPERNSSQSVSMGWSGHTHLRTEGLGANSCPSRKGFSTSLSRRRGMQEQERHQASRHPRGPNVTLIALMGLRIGLIHEKYIGGVNTKTFEDFLTGAAAGIREACGWEPVVTIPDSARVHGGHALRISTFQGQYRDWALPPVHHSTVRPRCNLGPQSKHGHHPETVGRVEQGSP